MRRRGCLISLAAMAGLVLVCCLVGWFVLLPRIEDQLTEGISEGLSTQVAEQLDAAGVDVGPGTHTLDVAQIESELADVGNFDPDEFELTASNGQISLQFGQTGQQFGYTGDISAENGRLVVTNMESSEGFFDFILSPDRLAEAIEDGVNGYFESRGLAIQSVTAENNQITVEAVETGR